jgi:DNA polymerase III subunit delta'
MDFAENWGILGHEWAVELLQGHLVNERARHAYLITGPQGIGRRTLALRMTQALNCPQPESLGIPCRQCSTCQRIERMQHPDLNVLQAEQVGGTLKVDQIRELLRGLSLAPYEATYKIALLLRFEEANPSAANALLKTLEEPPRQVKIFLTAQDAETLLPTIVSRCELIHLRPLSLDKVNQGLQNMWDIPSDQAQLLAHLSNGRPGYALRLYQNPEILEQRDSMINDHQFLLTANRVERFNYAENLVKDKTVLFQSLGIWLTLWRDVMLCVSGSSVPMINVDRAADIAHIANQVDLLTAKEMLNTLEKTHTRLNHYTNIRLTAEVLMLNLPQLA